MTYKINAQAMGSSVSFEGDDPEEVVAMFRDLMNDETVDFPALKASERIEEIN